MTEASSERAIPPPDLGVLDNVAERLDLRGPNRDALETISVCVERFYAEDSPVPKFFEGVVDAATGMGKTYIMAGVLEYYAAQGMRNFAVITPGSTIQTKTVDQFSTGSSRSLSTMLRSDPFVVHAGNFNTSNVAAALEDDNRVKLFIFTVQSLLRPNTKANRKTHTFQEGLGKAFYDHLDSLSDLVVLADEHHTYHGPKFSQALRGLAPAALLGFTATPDDAQLKRDGIPVIYRYPLAAAIGERYVKTPVIVGRKDDRTDERTQLLDAGALMRAKEQALAAYCAREGLPAVHAVTLVSCRDIAHAQETASFLRSTQYYDGEYAADGVVLEVHSLATKEHALAAFDGVDEPDSPVRIIVQVGMLKEGWDCKSVYVITSLRSSISDVLTEQTLGRGLRLPFGSYVDGEPLLNELDVVAHERYTDLLARSRSLTEVFIDHRTLALQEPAQPPKAAGPGATASTATSDGSQTIIEQAPVVASTDGSVGSASSALDAAGNPGAGGLVVVAGTEARIATAQKSASAAMTALPLQPRRALDTLVVPQMQTTVVPVPFSASMLTDAAAFRDRGFKLAAAPSEYLKRTRISATVSPNLLGGDLVISLRSEEATTKIAASQSGADEDAIRSRIVGTVLNAGQVQARPGERQNVERLLGLMLAGAGAQASALLLNYERTVARALIDAIVTERSKLNLSQVTELISGKPFEPRQRLSRPDASGDRHGEFVRGRPYVGFKKSLYEQDWFDSRPERDLANLVDATDSVDFWVRLQRDDLPILWSGAARTYNPDFLVLGTDGSHWVVEIKSDKDLPTADVQAKRDAALTWANAASGQLGAWAYLLAAERDLVACAGDWGRLVQLTGS